MFTKDVITNVVNNHRIKSRRRRRLINNRVSFRGNREKLKGSFSRILNLDRADYALWVDVYNHVDGLQLCNKKKYVI